MPSKGNQPLFQFLVYEICGTFEGLLRKTLKLFSLIVYFLWPVQNLDLSILIHDRANSEKWVRKRRDVILGTAQNLVIFAVLMFHFSLTVIAHAESRERCLKLVLYLIEKRKSLAN